MVDVGIVRIKLGCCGKVSETELGVLAGVLHTSLQLQQKEGEEENIGACRIEDILQAMPLQTNRSPCTVE